MNSFWISGPINHIYHHLRKHFQLSTYTKKHQHCDTPENNSTTIPHINHIFIPSFPSSRSHLFSRPILSFYTLFYLPQFSCKTFTKSNQYIHSSSIYPYYFCSPYIPLHTPETLLPYRSCLLSRLRLHYHHRSFASDGRPFFVQHSHPSVLYSQKRPRLWC